MYQKADSEIASFGVGIFVGMVLLAIVMMVTKSSPMEMTIKVQNEQSRGHLPESRGPAARVLLSRGVVNGPCMDGPDSS